MLFDLFKKKDEKGPTDVKSLRDALLRFVKEELQRAEGGEGHNIKGISLFINADLSEKHLYEAATYNTEPERFKEEIQRIADDFALDLPGEWLLEVAFTDELPDEVTKANGLNAAIFIRTKEHTLQKTGSGYIRILSGKAEKDEYQLNSSDGKVNIGRESKAQVSDGFFRLNQIAFPGDSSDPANKFVSRQHAHIEWSNDDACFVIFADEGGVPPGNKIKIKQVSNENLIKLQSTHAGHKLHEGDQIILGESAVLEYSNQSLANK